MKSNSKIITENTVSVDKQCGTTARCFHSKLTTAVLTTGHMDFGVSTSAWGFVSQAMQKQDDARRFIWAAEYKANELFCRLKDRSRYDASSRGVRAAENVTEDQFEEVQAALLQVDLISCILWPSIPVLDWWYCISPSFGLP